MMIGAPQSQVDSKISPEKMAHNDNIVYLSKVFSGIVFGGLAGMLGFTGVNGFIFFFITSLITSFMLLTTLPNFSSKNIFSSWTSVWLGGIMQALMTFILFWTVAYDSVYIFQ